MKYLLFVSLFILYVSQLCFAVSHNSESRKSARLYFQGETKQLYEIGTIEYDTLFPKSLGSFTKLSSIPATNGCFGFQNKLNQFKCLTSKISEENKPSGIFTLFLNEEGDITNLNFVESDGDKGFEVDVIRGVSDGPLPELKQPIKLVDDKIPEQEENKPFLQKYGIYLIPLVLFLLFAGGGE